jgi:hypothetical protein
VIRGYQAHIDEVIGRTLTCSLYAAVNTWKAASTRGEATACAGDARVGAQQATSTRRQAET